MYLVFFVFRPSILLFQYIIYVTAQEVKITNYKFYFIYRIWEYFNRTNYKLLFLPTLLPFAYVHIQSILLFLRIYLYTIQQLVLLFLICKLHFFLFKNVFKVQLVLKYVCLYNLSIRDKTNILYLHLFTLFISSVSYFCYHNTHIYFRGVTETPYFYDDLIFTSSCTALVFLVNSQLTQGNFQKKLMGPLFSKLLHV